MRAILVGLVAVGLVGCTSPPQKATITAINDSSLTVVAPTRMSAALIDIEAQSGCGIYSKRAYLVSSGCDDNYCVNRAYLYSCR